MKITMYELLGLVKDGKAPKKIKFRNEIYEYINNIEDSIIDYEGIEKETGERFYLSSHIGKNYISDIFTDEVEIIEETKTIEKILISMDDNSMPFVGNSQYKRLSYSETDLMMATKINELIDEINNLKDND